jgi:exodeoxyribonuclease VII large subunit
MQIPELFRTANLQSMDEHVLTVTSLTQAIRETLEAEFPIVHVVGEVSNYKLHQSGHRYFTLKDEGAQIRCVLWRGRQADVELRDGMQIKVRGRLTVYPLQGNYQIDCFSVMPAGIGDLYAAFEQLKRELAAAGYFDPSRKRPIPRLPQCIGVATSPSGAAIRDILSTLQRRNPAITIIVRPTIVQGMEAAEDIARAIADLEAAGCDVIIVGRGGGSIEDLWAFNTRIVADAIYRARVPIISAVGHETDVTIADFVADLRAATPTAAAELCTPLRREDILLWLDQWADSAIQSLEWWLEHAQQIIDDFTSNTTLQLLLSRCQAAEQNAYARALQAERALQHIWEDMARTAERVLTALPLLHPLAPLARGFALVERHGVLLSPSDSIESGDSIRIHRMKETATVSVTQIEAPLYHYPKSNGKEATNS